MPNVNTEKIIYNRDDINYDDNQRTITRQYQMTEREITVHIL